MSEIEKKDNTDPDEETIDSLSDDGLNEDWDGEDDIDEDEEENLESDVEGGETEDCVYKPLQKRRGIAPEPENELENDDDENDDDDIDIDDEMLETQKVSFITGDSRRSKAVLTKYEKTNLIGTRVAQLTMGAKPLIKGVSKMDPNDIAQMELEKGEIPIKIIRPMPDGTKEVWELKELKLKREHIKFNLTK